MSEQNNLNAALVIQSLTNQIAEMAQKIAVLEAMVQQYNAEEEEIQ